MDRRPTSVAYDPQVDALAIDLVEHPRPVRSVRFDRRRSVDYDAEGRVVSIALRHVSRGVNLDDVPESGTVRAVVDRLAAEHG